MAPFDSVGFPSSKMRIVLKPADADLPEKGLEGNSVEAVTVG